MGSSTATVRVLSAGAQLEAAPKAGKSGDELWLTTVELREASGWALKAEGLCKAGACVPLDASARAHVEGDLVGASGLWTQLGRPMLCDAAKSTWMLGEAAGDRARQLASLEAPDFTLPDIEGVLHSLSDFRGKKVLLATWASW